MAYGLGRLGVSVNPELVQNLTAMGITYTKGGHFTGHGFNQWLEGMCRLGWAIPRTVRAKLLVAVAANIDKWHGPTLRTLLEVSCSI